MRRRNVSVIGGIATAIVAIPKSLARHSLVVLLVLVLIFWLLLCSLIEVEWFRALLSLVLGAFVGRFILLKIRPYTAVGIVGGKKIKGKGGSAKKLSYIFGAALGAIFSYIAYSSGLYNLIKPTATIVIIPVIQFVISIFKRGD